MPGSLTRKTSQARRCAVSIRERCVTLCCVSRKLARWESEVRCCTSVLGLKFLLSLSSRKSSMAVRTVLPALREYACEVLPLAAALRDGFDLRVVIKKEASRAAWAVAPRPGFEPGTYRLTAGRSTV